LRRLLEEEQSVAAGEFSGELAVEVGARVVRR
jgi:hypothetical protein